MHNAIPIWYTVYTVYRILQEVTLELFCYRIMFYQLILFVMTKIVKAMEKVELSSATKVGLPENGLCQSKEQKILRCASEKKFRSTPVNRFAGQK